MVGSKNQHRDAPPMVLEIRRSKHTAHFGKSPSWAAAMPKRLKSAREMEGFIVILFTVRFDDGPRFNFLRYQALHRKLGGIVLGRHSD